MLPHVDAVVEGVGRSYLNTHTSLAGLPDSDTMFEDFCIPRGTPHIPQGGGSYGIWKDITTLNSSSLALRYPDNKTKPTWYLQRQNGGWMSNFGQSDMSASGCKHSRQRPAKVWYAHTYFVCQRV
jgi:hypothetical protein